ncbi:MAG: PEP-CTERM sorting domain-containing protein [Rivularia sp. (in: cyanobacteria)]
MKKLAFFAGILSATTSVLALTLTVAPKANAADIKAVDTVVIIDESGSMGGEQSWIQQVIPSLESAFKAAGFGSGADGNNYGLVGFGGGGSGNLGRTLTANGNKLFGANDFATAASNLVTSGGFEDGYSAIDYTFNNYNFRSSAVKNFILVTDEDRDNGNNALTSQNILNRLKNSGTLLNAVVNATFRDGNGTTALGIDSKANAYLADGSGGFTKSPGGTAVSGFGTTIPDYVDVALATSGAAWDLNQLRNGGDLAQSFTNGFIDIKVQEVVNTGGGNEEIPEPLTILGTLTAGAFGTQFMRKRKQMQAAKSEA